METKQPQEKEENVAHFSPTENRKSAEIGRSALLPSALVIPFLASHDFVRVVIFELTVPQDAECGVDDGEQLDRRNFRLDGDGQRQRQQVIEAVGEKGSFETDRAGRGNVGGQEKVT